MSHPLIVPVLLMTVLAMVPSYAQTPFLIIDVMLEDAPPPVDNPLKGLVPYVGQGMDTQGKTRFPHSMEFSYIPLRDLIVAPGQYDFSPLEKMLEEVTSRGHRLVFRIYLDYPNGRPGVPQYLLDAGVAVRRDTRDEYPKLYARVVEAIDYDDPRVVTCLRDFIAEFGKRYDGDPRIGFITAGLLGYWGEWHTYPANHRWAGKTTQNAVLDAYEKAFRVTPILLRYPAGPRHETLAANTHRPFGYHDDSFAWSTIDDGRPASRWHFQPQMEAQGAARRWETHPIGGEIRPEIWGRVFDDPAPAQAQDFAQCVAQTHVTWLMDSGMFTGKPASPDRLERALAQIRPMGYILHAQRVQVTVAGKNLHIRLTVENRGVAPFYFGWKAEYALIDINGRVAHKIASKHSPRGILPGDPTLWEDREEIAHLPKGQYTLAVRIVDPLESLDKPVRPLRWANAAQDRHAPGWLSLTSLTIP